jgi:hypothetical protein
MPTVSRSTDVPHGDREGMTIVGWHAPHEQIRPAYRVEPIR